MKVEVIGRPELSQDGRQVIHIDHSPSTDLTTIICNADLVTVGIASRVLQKKFDEIACTLSPRDFDLLHEALEKAVV